MKTRTHRFVRFTLIVSLGVTWACAARIVAQREPPAAPASRPEDSRSCEVIPDSGAPIETVALSERVDPANAPRPSNDSERLLFRQLYETLVRVDCNGRVAPGLAASWRLDPNGPAWIVTLRENARFSDGAPVTAADVISTWTIADGNGLRPEVRRFIRSITALDDRTLEITLENPPEDAPVSLAHADLAIAKRTPGSPWPLGTRLAKVAPNTAAPRATGLSEVTLIRLALDPAAANTASNLPSIRFLVAPGRDARDLLDEGVDLVVTRNPTALDYAATLPRFLSVPLAWQKTYALVEPGRSRESRPLSADEREALAHDAVRGEARGSLEPSWWQSLPGCGGAEAQPRNPSSALTPRVVYDGNDGVARDLAERLVGLGRASGPGAAAMLEALLPDRPRRTFQRAAGLTGEPLAQAERSGNDAAYIVALERSPLDPCREMRVLADAMGGIDPQTIVPLVDTRLQAIVRRGRSGMTAEWDGGLLMTDRAQ